MVSTQLRILIVEDHVAFRGLLARFVQSIMPHAHLVTHGDAPGALTVCFTEKPDVVLTDIELPGGDGLALASDIKKHFPHVAVIVVTSHDSAFLRERAVMAGADHYVQKEQAFERLPALLAGILGRAGGCGASRPPNGLPWVEE